MLDLFGPLREKTCLRRFANDKGADQPVHLHRSVSLNKLYKECGWLSLAERRRQQKLSFMFKAHSDLLPTYISDLMPPLVRNISNYPLRNMNNYSVPFARIEIFKKSCIPSAITLWNAADNNLKDSNTLHSFKYQMKKPFAINSKVPSYYASGNRRLSVLHARIRNNCSNLNLDLFNNFLRPDPTCSCQVEPENAEHYFLRCHKYTIQRLVLFNSLRNFLPLRLEILLYGNQNLTDAENEIIFESVHIFIKKLKPL